MEACSFLLQNNKNLILGGQNKPQSDLQNDFRMIYLMISLQVQVFFLAKHFSFQIATPVKEKTFKTIRDLHAK